MRLALPILLAAAALAAPAVAQETPSAWRRFELAPGVAAAVGTGAPANGTHHATLVTWGDDDRPASGGATFASIVIRAEIRCAERQWRILGTRFYDRSHAVVEEHPAVGWAPLVRESPLHSAITDVCDAPATGRAELTTTDVVAVQKWLDQ